MWRLVDFHPVALSLKHVFFCVLFFVYHRGRLTEMLKKCYHVLRWQIDAVSYVEV